MFQCVFAWMPECMFSVTYWLVLPTALLFDVCVYLFTCVNVNTVIDYVQCMFRTSMQNLQILENLDLLFCLWKNVDMGCNSLSQSYVCSCAVFDCICKPNFNTFSDSGYHQRTGKVNPHLHHLLPLGFLIFPLYCEGGIGQVVECWVLLVFEFTFCMCL